MENGNMAEMENSKKKQEKSKSQPPKLKVFEITQKNFVTVGITPNLVDQTYPFNGMILFGFLLLGSAIYCTFLFIIYDAETYAEYTQAIYISSVATLIIVMLMIVTTKAKKLFKFINACNDFVDTCELIYQN